MAVLARAETPRLNCNSVAILLVIAVALIGREGWGDEPSRIGLGIAGKGRLASGSPFDNTIPTVPDHYLPSRVTTVAFAENIDMPVPVVAIPPQNVAPQRYAEQHGTVAVSPKYSLATQASQQAEIVDALPRGLQTLPMADVGMERIDIHANAQGLFSLTLREAPLSQVLSILARSQGLNLLVSEDVDTVISGSFNDISFDVAMDSLTSLAGLSWTATNNVILVTRLSSESQASPMAQGRMVRVFHLNYVSAADVQKIVTTLLSPVGIVNINEISTSNSSQTREQIIVEDLPHYLHRIEQYILEIDRAPLQVLIEAHILQVDLQDNLDCGIDFAKFGELGSVPTLSSAPGFNGSVSDLSTFAAPSYSVAMLEGGRFSALLEALQRTTDAKTLASPKVMALNGQQAKVQIGEKLGYFITTTTQTSSLQSVEFLETGVVLTVTPRITEDGKILMTVTPEVSDGTVDEIGLPSERTTEVTTTLMLSDGMGMVVGGLIKEVDTENVQKLPILGSLWGIGKLFQHKQTSRERSEIIIALIPHIVTDCCPRPAEAMQFERATTPLMHGPLKPVTRPWEPAFETQGKPAVLGR